MSAVALIAAIGMVQAASPAPSPLFVAFRAPCTQVQQYSRIVPTARAAGWKLVPHERIDPRMRSILSMGRAAVLREDPKARYLESVLEQQIDGRTVYLSATRVEPKDVASGLKPSNGCRVFDLDMPRAPARNLIDGWVGRSPDSVRAEGLASKRIWFSWSNRASLEITYVPRNEKRGQAYGIQGLILVSQSNGGF